MRTGSILTIILLLTGVSCASLQKSLLDGVRYIIPFIGDASADEEEIEKEKQTKTQIKKAVEYLKATKFKDPLLFHSYQTLDPDEGGGVSIEVLVWNSKPDVIDRLEIVTQAYDEDNRPHLQADKPVRLPIKGPIPAHKQLVAGAGKNNPQPYTYTVRNVWWSDSIACSKINEVTIVYGNGKQLRLTGDDLAASLKFAAPDNNFCR